jgi:hypothetical protein
MEQNIEKKVAVIKKSDGASVRVDKDTRKMILGELAKINKKAYGRKIRAGQLIRNLLAFVTPEFTKRLQEESLSNKDRMEMQFKEHVKKFGPISKDEFIGLFLRANVSKSVTENDAKSETKNST